MNLKLFFIFAVALPLTVNALNLDDLNSVYLSQLRFKLRLVNDPLEQCIRYHQSISNKLKGLDDAADQPLPSKNINIALLTAVSDLLKSRSVSYGSNSLMEYTENCGKVLSSYKGTDYVIIDEALTQSTAKVINDVSGQQVDQQEMERLKQENARLQLEVNEKIQSLSDAEAKLTSYEDILATTKRTSLVQIDELKRQLDGLKSSQTKAEEARDKCMKELQVVKDGQVCSQSEFKDQLSGCRRELDIAVEARSVFQHQRDVCQVKLSEQESSLEKCQTNLESEKRARGEADEERKRYVQISSDLREELKSCIAKGKSDVVDPLKYVSKDELSKCQDQVKANQLFAEKKQKDAEIACKKNIDELKDALEACKAKKVDQYPEENQNNMFQAHPFIFDDMRPNHHHPPHVHYHHPHRHHHHYIDDYENPIEDFRYPARWGNIDVEFI